MNPDYAVVIGVFLIFGAMASVVSAFSAGRSMRNAAYLFLIGCGLIVWALIANPGGYALRDVPALVVDVVSQLVPD